MNDNSYIEEINGISALKNICHCQSRKIIIETEVRGRSLKMKTEKILNISLILNASLSLAVILLSISMFAIVAYGTIGIYD